MEISLKGDLAVINPPRHAGFRRLSAVNAIIVVNVVINLNRGLVFRLATCFTRLKHLAISSNNRLIE